MLNHKTHDNFSFFSIQYLIPKHWQQKDYLLRNNKFLNYKFSISFLGLNYGS